MIIKLIRKGLELPILIMTFISKVFVCVSDLYVSLLRFILRKDFRFERRLAKGVYEIFEDLKKNIVHTTTKGISIPLVFYTPNAICKIRAETFSTKEPEILQWIDENGDDKPFWDIGACIGLYSIYFAKSCSGRVVSFEPSFFNLKQLAKNIFINQVYEQIDIVPTPLTNKKGFQKFAVSGGEEGGATNAFGVDYGGDGEKIHKEFQYNVMGISADDFLQQSPNYEIPKLIKIDVDGIEHLILSGMKNILLSRECQSVYVEVMDSFTEQAANVESILLECGFYLDKKYDHSSTNNQIWFKK